MLLLEQGVLWVLPMLWAALLFSEAGGVVGTCCLPAVSPAVDKEKGRRKTRYVCAFLERPFFSLPFYLMLSIMGRRPYTIEVVALVGVLFLKPFHGKMRTGFCLFFV